MNQNRQDIDEEILLHYLLGNADETSRDTVEEWLNADGGNRKQLDRLESLWLETGKLLPHPVAVDVEAAWLRMAGRIVRDEKTKSQSQPSGKTIRMIPYRYLVSLAAMVMLLIGIYSIYRLVTKPVKQIELASSTVIVHDTLPDGSQVTLNKNSTLVYPEEFKKGSRMVKLSGEAFFEVKHDETHPFIVHAGPVGIRVLGTTFSVQTSPGGVEGVVVVSVTEGRVMFFKVNPRTGDTASVVLSAGTTGIWQSGSDMPIFSGSTVPDGNFWANHSLYFRSTALSEVISLIEKYYSVNITTGDPGILDCRLTASFVNEPADRILAVIAESFSLKLETHGKNFHFTGHGCSKENN